MVLWSDSIGALTKIGKCSFQWCVLFIYMSDQTLAEQLYHDKGLIISPQEKKCRCIKIQKKKFSYVHRTLVPVLKSHITA